MAAPGPCPECGLPFGGPDSTLVLHGIAKQQETSAWRRWAWVALILIAFALSQAIVPLVLARPLLGAIASFSVLAGVVAMILTGSSGRRASERFVFAQAGLSRTTPGQDAVPRFHPWAPHTTVELCRIGSVWYRLKLTETGDHRPRKVLDAGIRCPDSDAAWVERSIRQLIAGEPPDLLLDPSFEPSFEPSLEPGLKPSPGTSHDPDLHPEPQAHTRPNPGPHRERVPAGPADPAPGQK